MFAPKSNVVRTFSKESDQQDCLRFHCWDLNVFEMQLNDDPNHSKASPHSWRPSNSTSGKSDMMCWRGLAVQNAAPRLLDLLGAAGCKANVLCIASPSSQHEKSHRFDHAFITAIKSMSYLLTLPKFSWKIHIKEQRKGGMLIQFLHFKSTINFGGGRKSGWLVDWGLEVISSISKFISKFLCSFLEMAYLFWTQKMGNECDSCIIKFKKCF